MGTIRGHSKLQFTCFNPSGEIQMCRKRTNKSEMPKEPVQNQFVHLIMALFGSDCIGLLHPGDAAS